MKIHLHQIPPEGLHLDGEEDCPITDLAEVRCIGPLRYNLDLGTSDGALWAQGTIAQRVELSCVRCLEKFQHDIRVPGFALHSQLPGPETIDITPFLREDILLNLPAHPHCDLDGARVCKLPETGAYTSEEEEKREHDWGALNKLRIENR